MYCKKCGSPNDDDAVYCKKCGMLLESEDETRVVPRSIAETAGAIRVGESPFVIGPTLKFVKLGYVAAALGAFLLVVLLAVTHLLPIWLAVVFGFALFLIPAYFHLQQRLIKYSLKDDCIEVDSGLISRTTRNIPLTRIQDVTVTSGMLQRILNFGDVVIDNASEDGGKVVIKNIDSPRKYADRLLGNVRRLER
jgi:uncharacterized membrane protein YdbT with pleckstrin-like domain